MFQFNNIDLSMALECIKKSLESCLDRAEVIINAWPTFNLECSKYDYLIFENMARDEN